MTQNNDTAKEWVLYIHRWGHTLAIGCYKSVDEAKMHKWLTGADIVWNQTHETGYVGYLEMLPMYPRFGQWTPYYTINQDGRFMYRLMNPVERLKLHQEERNRNVFQRFARWVTTAPDSDSNWRNR